MRLTALVLLGLGFCVAQPAGWAKAQNDAVSAAKRAAHYDGVWGSNDAACRDEDGVNRMLLRDRHLEWYETRCEAQEVTAVGRRVWRMRVTCEGEGQRFRARPWIRLVTPNRLVMDGSPVGPTKRQVYVRCRNF